MLPLIILEFIVLTKPIKDRVNGRVFEEILQLSILENWISIWGQWIF